jgi:hypothetical protein
MAIKSSEYRKAPEGDTTTFTVTPGGVPKFGTMIGMGVVCTLIGLGSMGGKDGGFGLVFLLMGGFSLWYGWSRDLRPKEHRRASTFRVSRQGIESNGRRFATEDIHRLLLRNSLTDQELGDVQIYNAGAGAVAGMAYRARVSQMANALTLEAGGKSYLLAGGLDETTAYGLLHEVSRILGFK